MSDLKAPPALAKPRLPRGLVDRGPADLAATERMLAAIRDSYALYGFEAVETPLIEYTDALGKFLPDLDRPNAGVFSFKDDDESWLSLRYDLTAPLARYVAEHFDALPKPYRSFRVGHVFRNEKPGPGRFRQFMQFDADTVGSASVAADAEMAMMAADTLEALGIKRGDYVLKINNRKILDGVMESIGLAGPENGARRLTVLRAMDKFDKFGVEGVRLLLGAGRRDESGDFTKGAGLDNDQQHEIVTWLSSNAQVVEFNSLTGLKAADAQREKDVPELAFCNDETLKIVAAHFGNNEKVRAGIEELQGISDICAASGFYTKRIRIDPSVVRGLEYYTGAVFEAELTFSVTDEEGRAVRFGSVGGGGRYDGLVARFRPDPVPATGFSIGVSRLYAALKAVGSPLVTATAQPGPVVVLVLDRDQLAAYQRLVTRLRAAGIRAELYLGQAGMNAQLKYADRRGSRCAVIQGSNEREAAGGPQVMVRDLALGAELAGASKDRADYLELRQRAQFAVAEERMVEAVREVLGRGAPRG